MAAVAAAVVALIVTPIMIFQGNHSPVGPAGSIPEASGQPEVTAPPSSAWKPGVPQYIALEGEILATDPVSTGSVNLSNGRDFVSTYVYALQMPKGYSQLCQAQVLEGEPINGPQQAKYGAPQCQILAPPVNEKVVSWGSRDVTTPGNRPNGSVYAYVMSPPTDRVMVRLPDNSYAVSASKAVGKQFTLFVVYLNGPIKPIAWSALDANNKQLQNGS